MGVKGDICFHMCVHLDIFSCWHLLTVLRMFRACVPGWSQQKNVRPSFSILTANTSKLLPGSQVRLAVVAAPAHKHGPSISGIRNRVPSSQGLDEESRVYSQGLGIACLFSGIRNCVSFLCLFKPPLGWH